jgi:hypothetical protein
MTDIFNAAGDKLGEIALSEKQRAALEAGTEITVLYHTPQLLRGVLGSHNGTFTLHKDGERIVTAAPDAVKRFADMQKAIRAARENG